MQLQQGDHVIDVRREELAHWLESLVPEARTKYGTPWVALAATHVRHNPLRGVQHLRLALEEPLAIGPNAERVAKAFLGYPEDTNPIPALATLGNALLADQRTAAAEPEPELDLEDRTVRDEHIRRLRAEGQSYRKIADAVGMSVGAVHKIAGG
jgi:DNA-directed RNA polymerase specialized sigma24 family protein